MNAVNAACMTCTASLACVAGIAEGIFRCIACGKMTVMSHGDASIIVGEEKPTTCNVPRLRWSIECTLCLHEHQREVGAR